MHNLSTLDAILGNDPPPIEDPYQAISERLAADVDAALHTAISRRFGRDDWAMGELKGRVVMLGNWVDGATYYLDEKPLLRLSPKPVEIRALKHEVAIDLEYL